MPIFQIRFTRRDSRRIRIVQPSNQSNNLCPSFYFFLISRAIGTTVCLAFADLSGSYSSQGSRTCVQKKTVAPLRPEFQKPRAFTTAAPQTTSRVGFFVDCNCHLQEMKALNACKTSLLALRTKTTALSATSNTTAHVTHLTNQHRLSLEYPHSTSCARSSSVRTFPTHINLYSTS